GVKVLSFCTILAMASSGAAEAAGPDTGSSHTTTPEKSMCLRTAASCESRSSTRPDTEPAISGLKPARLTNSRLLEKVRKSEVIMRIHHCARSQIGGAHLGGFKTCQYIR